MTLAPWLAAADPVEYPAVEPGRPLRFPEDHGAHPAFRNEWWYVTGRLGGGVPPTGFQVTFFRSRPGVAEGLTVATAPRQLVFAHAALADSATRRLLHAQRSARSAWGLAFAKEGTIDVAIDDWSLRMTDANRLATLIRAPDFAFQLNFAAVQPVLLEGEAGFSRKGPETRQASYYYSWPQLRVTGSLDPGSGERSVEGVAWLDHEWSSEYMAPQAVGWDWTGIDLDDGGAFMAFRMRGRDGTPVWAGATWRKPGGATVRFGPAQVRFEVQRTWRSPSTGATYPVAMQVQGGDLTIDLRPLFDEQELDARASVGTVYWEGAVDAWANGAAIGRGYLELTGYAGRLAI